MFLEKTNYGTIKFSPLDDVDQEKSLDDLKGVTMRLDESGLMDGYLLHFYTGRALFPAKKDEEIYCVDKEDFDWCLDYLKKKNDIMDNKIMHRVKNNG